MLLVELFSFAFLYGLSQFLLQSACITFKLEKNKVLNENEELLLPHLKNIVINTTDPQMTSYYLSFSLVI